MSVSNGIITIIPPPKGYVVDFDNPQMQYVVKSYTVAAVEMTLGFLFLVQRLYTKIAIMKNFQLEDCKSILASHTQRFSSDLTYRHRHCRVGILHGGANLSTPRIRSWSHWSTCLGN
jgi:hypothetical protein